MFGAFFEIGGFGTYLYGNIISVMFTFKCITFEFGKVHVLYF